MDYMEDMERKKYKRKNLIIAILTTIILIIGCVCVKYYLDYKHEKDAEQKAYIEAQYRSETYAFGMEQASTYKDFSNVDINILTMYLAAYKHFEPSAPELSIEDVKDFLSSEYDGDGKLRVLNQPKNISEYITWFYFLGGASDCDGYIIYLMQYQRDQSKYQDVDLFTTDIDVLNRLIEDFTNCPNREDYEVYLFGN